MKTNWKRGIFEYEILTGFVIRRIFCKTNNQKSGHQILLGKTIKLDIYQKNGKAIRKQSHQEFRESDENEGSHEVNCVELSY